MIQTAIVSGLVLSRAAVRDMVGTDEAASLFGYITMGMALVPMVGPAIGGYLDEIYGWQAAFFVTFIFGVLVLLIAALDMGETNHTPSTSFAAQFRAYPELIRSRRFWGYALSAAFTSGSFFAFLGGAPYISINLLGLSPSELGAYFALTAIGYIAGNFLSGRYAMRVGINPMILMGNIVVAIGVFGSIVTFAIGFSHPLAFFGFMVFPWSRQWHNTSQCQRRRCERSPAFGRISIRTRWSPYDRRRSRTFRSVRMGAGSDNRSLPHALPHARLRYRWCAHGDVRYVCGAPSVTTGHSGSDR